MSTSTVCGDPKAFEIVQLFQPPYMLDKHATRIGRRRPSTERSPALLDMDIGSGTILS